MDNSVAPMVITDDGLQETAISSKKNPSKGRWRAAIFIIFVEMAERFAYYGVAGNLFTYLTNVLGEPTATAAKNVNTWVGVSAIFPLLGGFIADSYLGRFKTIIASSVIYLAGLLLMTLSVSVQSLRPHRAVFFTALYILSIGEGGHKPCVQTFAADQFDEDTVEEKKDKSSFFNWWYVGIVVGSTTAILVVIYVQDNVGWGLGFGMLAAAVAAALLLFLIGIRSYRRQRPVGSPLTRVVQVLVAAARKLRVNETRYGRGVYLDDEGDGGAEEGGRRGGTLAPTNQFRFLDKATIIDDIDASTKVRNHWRLCPATQVEEVKLLFSLFPIWLSCLTFATVIAQMSTYFTKQGSTLERSIGSHFSIPPASLQVCTGLTILVSVGLYDRVLVPVARKFTGLPSGITMLQRIGTGIFFSMLTMVVAALVETKRISVAIDHGLTDSPRTTLPMKIWWLLPQYMLTGMCDVFTIVGMQELFYDQMPEEMRSIGAALYISTVGVGSLMSSAAISIVQAITSRAGEKWLGDNLNRAHLNYFYSVLAGCSALNLIVYIWVAKRFVYKKIGCDDPKGEQKKAAELA
ncbi:hypothetical protein PVL29_017409 [Vitis rotundifolia]|uniref:Protein NRT1/ PTR FAMILY 5.4 n=1 Tax=Vitis rotundifolia TaxID=103349 RepID=A0AA38ZAN4_VITRO|nr:hypothetical protein PVL29_017409 [Vitis rotundifolia]